MFNWFKEFQKDSTRRGGPGRPGTHAARISYAWRTHSHDLKSVPVYPNSILDPVWV